MSSKKIKKSGASEFVFSSFRRRSLPLSLSFSRFLFLSLVSLSSSFLSLLRSAPADTERLTCPTRPEAQGTHAHAHTEERERASDRENEEDAAHICYASSACGVGRRRRHLLLSAPAPAPAGCRRRRERQAHPRHVRCRLCERADPRGRGEVRELKGDDCSRNSTPLFFDAVFDHREWISFFLGSRFSLSLS